MVQTPRNGILVKPGGAVTGGWSEIRVNPKPFLRGLSAVRVKIHKYCVVILSDVVSWWTKLFC